MGTRVRTCSAGLVVLAALTAAVVRPDWFRPLGDGEAGRRDQPPLWVVSEPLPEVAILRQRSAEKERVVDRLAAGELDLFGAAACFRRIDDEPAEYRWRTYRLLPGGTDEEKFCRQVILWVKGCLGDKLPRSEVERLIAELEAALADRLRRTGKVELPDRP